MKTYIVMQENGKFMILKTKKIMHEGTIERLNNGQEVYISEVDVETRIEEPAIIREGQISFINENEFPEPHME